MGKLFGFLGVSAICGVLVAGLLVPAVALTGTTTSNSINFFDHLPGELKIDAPAQSTKVLANDGSVLASFFAENRVDVGLNEMSPFIKEGIVAIEDSRFYEHGGIDTTGILRALAATAQGGRQGASTITQQYVNNVIIESQVSSGNSDQVKLGSRQDRRGQDPRDEARHRHGEEVLQGRHPQGLPEHRLLQQQRLRD